MSLDFIVAAKLRDKIAVLKEQVWFSLLLLLQ